MEEKIVKLKRKMSLILTIIMCLSLFNSLAMTSIVAKAETKKVGNPTVKEDGSILWDKIQFGSYYQDFGECESEQIKWRILSVDKEGNALLLADEVLVAKSFNEKGIEKQRTDEDGETYLYTDYSATWETCTLRDWLNGTDEYADDSSAFIKEAFSDSEREQILKTYIDNNDELTFENTGDKGDDIFLLSMFEASNEKYGFDNTFENDSKTRQCKMTDYAFINGGNRVNGSNYDNNGSWLLRTSDTENYDAMYVNYLGNGVQYDEDDASPHAVRPALYINLNDAALYIEDAGKISSDGDIIETTVSDYFDDGYVNPVISDGVTIWDCIYFGTYKQHATFIKKPIEWRVLSVDGTKALLLSDKVIDAKSYDTDKSVAEADENGIIHYIAPALTWENCMLRSWLNGIGDYEDDGTAFIKAAFTNDERSAIIDTDVDDSPYDATKDKIFLLSRTDASNEKYGFGTNIFQKSKMREVKSTDYAYFSGVYRSNESNIYGNSCWWIRNFNMKACAVDEEGMGDDCWSKNDCCFGVRPALYVDLSKLGIEVKGDSGANNDENVDPSDTAEQKEEGKSQNNGDDTKKENIPEQLSSQQQVKSDGTPTGSDGSSNINNDTSSKKIEVGETIEKDDFQYIVTENSEGNVEVSYQAPENTKVTSYVVPDTVTLSDGTVAQVTAVAPNAFKKCKKLKKVVLGKNIEKVGKNAFNGCKNLKTITIKSTKLTKKSFGKNAFKGISKKASITVPKKQYKNYKKWLKAAGLPNGVKIKKK